MSAAEVMKQIRALPPEEFSHVVEELREDLWDSQIERDAANGALDRMWQNLEEENAGHPNTPLNDFLHKEELSDTAS